MKSVAFSVAVLFAVVCRGAVPGDISNYYVAECLVPRNGVAAGGAVVLVWTEAGYRCSAKIQFGVQSLGGGGPQRAYMNISGAMAFVQSNGQWGWVGASGGLMMQFAGSPMPVLLQDRCTINTGVAGVPVFVVSYARLGSMLTACGAAGGSSGAMSGFGNQAAVLCSALGFVMENLVASESGGTTCTTYLELSKNLTACIENMAYWTGVYTDGEGGGSGSGGGLTQEQLIAALNQTFGTPTQTLINAPGAVPARSGEPKQPTRDFRLGTTTQGPVMPTLPTVTSQTATGGIEIPWVSCSGGGWTQSRLFTFSWTSLAGDVFPGFGSAIDTWRTVFRTVLLGGLGLVCVVWVWTTLRQL